MSVKACIDPCPFMSELRQAEHRAAVEAHARRCDACILMVGLIAVVGLLAGWFA